MKQSCFIRKIDELGRVVLPIEMRQYLEIKERDSLEFFLEDNCILIKKQEPSCVFCHTTTQLKELEDKYICKNCTNKIKSFSAFNV